MRLRQSLDRIVTVLAAFDLLWFDDGNANLIDLFDIVAADLLSMYDHCSDTLVWVKDAKGLYVWGNRQFLLNFSLHSVVELAGKSDYDLTPIYLAVLYGTDDKRVLSGQPVVGRIEPVTGIEGLPQWCQTWKSPLRNGEEKIVGTIGLSRPTPADDSPQFPIPELLPALRRMQDYLEQNSSNEELANLCGMSVRAFERKFKSYFQLTPNQFVNRIRVTRAAEFLCTVDVPLVDVAGKFGFSDQSHMTREFRKHFGTTPKAYRDRHR